MDYSDGNVENYPQEDMGEAMSIAFSRYQEVHSNALQLENVFLSIYAGQLPNTVDNNFLQPNTSDLSLYPGVSSFPEQPAQATTTQSNVYQFTNPIPESTPESIALEQMAEKARGDIERAGNQAA